MKIIRAPSVPRSAASGEERTYNQNACNRASKPMLARPAGRPSWRFAQLPCCHGGSIAMQAIMEPQ